MEDGSLLLYFILGPERTRRVLEKQAIDDFATFTDGGANPFERLAAGLRKAWRTPKAPTPPVKPVPTPSVPKLKPGVPSASRSLFDDPSVPLVPHPADPASLLTPEISNLRKKLLVGGGIGVTGAGFGGGIYDTLPERAPQRVHETSTKAKPIAVPPTPPTPEERNALVANVFDKSSPTGSAHPALSLLGGGGTGIQADLAGKGTPMPEPPVTSKTPATAETPKPDWLERNWLPLVGGGAAGLGALGLYLHNRKKKKKEEDVEDEIEHYKSSVVLAANPFKPHHKQPVPDTEPNPLMENWPLLAGGAAGVAGLGGLAYWLHQRARKRKEQEATDASQEPVKQSDYLGRKYDEAERAVQAWEKANPQRADNVLGDALTNVFLTTPARMGLGGLVGMAKAPEGHALQGAARGAGYGLGMGVGGLVGTGINNVVGNPDDIAPRLGLQLGGSALGALTMRGLMGPSIESRIAQEAKNKQRKLQLLNEMVPPTDPEKVAAEDDYDVPESIGPLQAMHVAKAHSGRFTVPAVTTAAETYSEGGMPLRGVGARGRAAYLDREAQMHAALARSRTLRYADAGLRAWPFGHADQLADLLDVGAAFSNPKNKTLADATYEKHIGGKRDEPQPEPASPEAVQHAKDVTPRTLENAADVQRFDSLIAAHRRNRHESPGHYWLNPFVPSGPLSEIVDRLARRGAAVKADPDASARWSTYIPGVPTARGLFDDKSRRDKARALSLAVNKEDKETEKKADFVDWLLRNNLFKPEGRANVGDSMAEPVGDAAKWIGNKVNEGFMSGVPKMFGGGGGAPPAPTGGTPGAPGAAAPKGDFLDNSRWANWALYGAPIGAGLGLLGGALGGRKKKRNLLGDALTGGLLGAGVGGLAGGAYGLMGDKPPDEQPKPSPEKSPLGAGQESVDQTRRDPNATKGMLGTGAATIGRGLQELDPSKFPSGANVQANRLFAQTNPGMEEMYQTGRDFSRRYDNKGGEYQDPTVLPGLSSSIVDADKAVQAARHNAEVASKEPGYDPSSYAHDLTAANSQYMTLYNQLNNRPDVVAAQKAHRAFGNWLHVKQPAIPDPARTYDDYIALLNQDVEQGQVPGTAFAPPGRDAAGGRTGNIGVLPNDLLQAGVGTVAAGQLGTTARNLFTGSSTTTRTAQDYAEKVQNGIKLLASGDTEGLKAQISAGKAIHPSAADMSFYDRLAATHNRTPGAVPITGTDVRAEILKDPTLALSGTGRMRNMENMVRTGGVPQGTTGDFFKRRIQPNQGLPAVKVPVDRAEGLLGTLTNRPNKLLRGVADLTHLPQTTPLVVGGGVIGRHAIERPDHTLAETNLFNSPADSTQPARLLAGSPQSVMDKWMESKSSLTAQDAEALLKMRGVPQETIAAYLARHYGKK